MSGIYNPGSSGGGAPTNAQYVVLSADGTLSAERVLTAGTTGPAIALTDAGAGSTITVDIANEQWAVCTSQLDATNTAVLANVTGLAFTIGSSATEVWQFECQCLTAAAGASSDHKFGLTVPASATYLFGAHSEAAASDSWGAGTGSSQIALSSTTISLGSFNGSGGCYFRGFVFGGGTGGTVQVQYAQASATVGQTNSIKVNSFLLARKIKA